MQDHPSQAATAATDDQGSAPTTEREFGDSRDLPDFHARRGALYGFVAAAFEFPDAEVFGDLADEEVGAAVREAAAELARADDGADVLPERVDALLDAVEETDRETVESAYHAVFGLPDEDSGYPVVPYEAEYATTGDVNDVQRRVATIVGLYERFDLEPHEEFDERQDHVAALLELASVLATQRAVALEDGDAAGAAALADAEATVLDEHLVGFVPALAHDVADLTADADRGSGRAVYRAAADLAAALVEWDHRLHPDPSVDADVAEDAAPDGTVPKDTAADGPGGDGS